eukprot:c9198_g1_i1 orf=578-4012(+)
MKFQGDRDRKKQSDPHHLGKLPPKYGGSSKSKHGQTFKDKRQSVLEKTTSQRTSDEPCPSQHLWVGNVSTSVTKTLLAEQFSRFGDVESVKLFSSKSYAFVSLKTVEDAVYAKKGLHGTVFGGLAIRIEFAKGVQDGRMSNQSQGNEKIMPEKERQTEEKIIFQDKGQKDGAITYQEKQPGLVKTVNSEEDIRQPFETPKGNKNCDPSEVLWIGFPLHLKIDERKLHKLFAPFGGVEKITTFPGRTYAFVRFQNVKAASRAKDALQGKLFDDPRVSISFAKSEVGPIDHYQATSESHPSSPMKVQVGTRTAPSFSLRKKEEEASIFPPASSAKMEVETSNYASASPGNDEVLLSIAPLSNFGNLTSLRDEKQIGIESQWSASPFFTAASGRVRNEKPCSPNQCIQPKLITDIKGDLLENAVFKHGPKLETNEGLPVLQRDDFSERKDIRSDERWMLHEEYGSKREQKRGRLEMEHPTNGALSSLGSSLASIDKSRVQVENGEVKRQRLGDEHFWGEGTNNISGADPNYTDTKTYLLSHETWDDQKVQKKGLLGRTPSSHNNEETNISLGSEDSWENKEGPQRGLLGKVLLPDSDLDQSMVFKNEHGLVESPISPAPTGVESPVCPPPKDLFRWEGVIAKGGMEVCHCRCFPATKEIDVMFPDILNCTARTSLDMLASYISQVREFSVVLFMPQGVPDVAPYQELMAFLADKQRAAVCKLSEENTLFLVPPSDFVEQFLNVPKSNNILGVVLSQQQHQSQPSTTLTDQKVFFQPKQTFLVDDLKKQNYQKLDVYATTEDHATSVVTPAHSSTEMKTTQPSSSQQIGYQLPQTDGSNGDPGLPTSFQSFFGKSLVGQDKSQDHDVVVDNGRMMYQTQGKNSLPVEYQVHENNPMPDKKNVPYQIMGNNSMLHGVHMFGGSSIPHGSKLLPHQESGMASRPLMFFPPQTSVPSEQLSVPGSTQMTLDSQKLFGPFPFLEQPWSAPVAVPQSAPSPQLNPPLAHLQQSFTYGSTHSQQQFPPFTGGKQDGQVQSSNFAFEPAASTARNMLLPYPPVLESGLRPPGPPPGPPPLESGLRPPGLPPGPLPAPLFQDREKQGVETEQHQALQLALAGLQGQDGSEEDQKKFRATVELAAALLQQLQQQTKS